MKIGGIFLQKYFLWCIRFQKKFSRDICVKSLNGEQQLFSIVLCCSPKILNCITVLVATQSSLNLSQDNRLHFPHRGLQNSL